MVLEGELTPNQIQQINDKTDNGGFIPSQVGLVDLQEVLQDYDSQDWGDDHPFHEDIVFTTTTEEANHTITAQELYENFMAVTSWNENMEVGHILGDHATPNMECEDCGREYVKENHGDGNQCPSCNSTNVKELVKEQDEV